MEWKVSNFNIVLPFKEKKYFIYNTRTTSSIIVDDSFYQNLYFNRVIEKNSDELQLRAMGFIVDAGINELDALKNLWNISKCKVDTSLKTILIAPTMNCNANCYYCFEKNSIKSNTIKNLSEQVRQNIINYITSNCIDKAIGIHWFGGEPLMAVNDIEYICNALEEKGIDILPSRMTTNGSLINTKIVKSLRKWNVTKLQITIDNIGENYNAIKNYNAPKDYFSIVINNILLLLDSGFNVNIRINFDPQKFQEASNTIDWLINKFNDYPNCFIYVAPISDSNVVSVTEQWDGEHPYYKLIQMTRRYKRYNLVVTSEETDLYQDVFHDTCVKINDRTKVLLRNNYLQPIPLPCMAIAKSSICIDPQGLVYRCHRLLGRGENYAVGMLDTNGIVEIHNKAERLFEEIAFPYPECNTCKVAPLCMGGCKSNRLLYEKGQVCCHIKGIVDDLVLDYLHAVISPKDLGSTR